MDFSFCLGKASLDQKVKGSESSEWPKYLRSSTNLSDVFPQLDTQILRFILNIPAVSSQLP